MTSYSMDVELFISEVKKFPEIWDNNSEDSRFRNRRQLAWAEVARVFIEDYDDMTSAEKNDVYKKLQSKWRNIRDSFVRHKRRNSKRGYIYARHMAFLDDLYSKMSPSGGDLDGLQNDGDDAWTSDADDDTKLKKILLKSEFDTKSEPEWTSDVAPAKRKRPPQPEMEFVESTFPEASCSYDAEDEDRSFFLSLLPAVREFSTDQKLEFRSDVLRLIKQYRSNDQSFRARDGNHL